MCRLLRLAVLALVAILGSNAVQVQEKDDGIPQMLSVNELPEQIRGLQKNVSDLWTYIFELRKAMSLHLTHLRQHQIELEQSVRKMPHHGSSHSGHDEVHGHDHHGEDHTGHSDSEAHHEHHGDDHHGHSDASHDHGHTDSSHDHGHSDSSHDHGHTESSHDHGHSDSEHGHSDSDHGHSESDHHHGHSDSGHDHGHSDSGHDHGHGDDHHHHDYSNEHHSSHEQGSHHAHHGDSHEKTDSKEQTQQQEVAEKVVMATHVHHHHDHAKPEGAEKKDPLQLFQGEHHHHHHSHGGYSRNRTTLPKYSEYNLYDFAVCEVQANRAIAPELQQDVRGQVSLWQRKTGGPLSIHLRLQGFKIGDHHGQHGMQQTTQEDNEAPVHAGGHRHGFHVHTNGDLSNGCQSTGPHFNPVGVNHGGPTAIVRHVGDLGNIACDEHGVTNIVFNDNVVSLSGQHSILGKSMVIHANEDDYGLKENDLESTKTGNAGTRIACCVIEKVDKLPLKAYKAIKQATQHQNR